MLFDKKPRTFSEDDSAFNKYCWVNWISLHKTVKMNVYITLLEKNYTQSRLRTNTRFKTIKLFEKDRRKALQHWFHNFFYMMPKVQARKAKINKGDYVKLKSIYTQKNQQSKREPPKQEKIHANYIF